ncbi:hypothetical protein B296_00023282 [Ensete ventricosum]|uniref:Secreted protein n=1 Tax=Ensete ventricosum TaxID=4639 RepID=A0A426XJK8_ENSVE|nr:hypothetical protein B296_00023282 [Ensete ventricosum]
MLPPLLPLVLHAVGMGSCPFGRRCCPRATPRGQAMPPCVGAAPTGGRSCRRAALCGLAVGSCHLWPGMPASACHAHGRPRLLSTAPAMGFGRGQSPPYKGPWPQPVAPCSWPSHG